jgi:hypothetical protein
MFWQVLRVLAEGEGGLGREALLTLQHLGGLRVNVNEFFFCRRANLFDRRGDLLLSTSK